MSAPGQDWLDATASRPLEVLKRGKSQFPQGHPIRELYRDARTALNDRNRIVHSLAFFDGSPESGASHGWVLVHPQTVKDIPMPKPHEYMENRERLNSLSATAEQIEKAVAADSVRTCED